MLPLLWECMELTGVSRCFDRVLDNELLRLPPVARAPHTEFAQPTRNESQKDEMTHPTPQLRAVQAPTTPSVLCFRLSSCGRSRRRRGRAVDEVAERVV